MKAKILVVDDEEWIASLLQDYLVEQGFDVELAYKLAEARRILARTPLPDLLVLDVMLPDGNGIEFLAEIRSSPLTKALPVVVISAHRVQVQDRISGFESGADEYMVKPFDLKEFKSRIVRLIQRVQAAQTSPAPEAGAGDAPRTSEP